MLLLPFGWFDLMIYIKRNDAYFCWFLQEKIGQERIGQEKIGQDAQKTKNWQNSLHIAHGRKIGQKLRTPRNAIKLQKQAS